LRNEIGFIQTGHRVPPGQTTELAGFESLGRHLLSALRLGQLDGRLGEIEAQKGKELNLRNFVNKC